MTHLVLLIFLFWDLGMVRSLLGRLCQLLRSEEAIGKHTIGPLIVRFQADALFQQWNGSGAVTTFPREVSLRRFSSYTSTLCMIFTILVSFLQDNALCVIGENFSQNGPLFWFSHRLPNCRECELFSPATRSVVIKY